MKKIIASVVFSAISSVSLMATATTIVTNFTQFNQGYTVSNTDLLQTSLLSSNFTGSFTNETTLGTSAFTNGIFGLQGNQSGTSKQAATPSGGSVATFTFIGANGYNISSIDSYAGWDRYRGGQSYAVSYATASMPTTYINLATIFNNAIGSNSSMNTNTHANIVANSGFLATNVKSLRFTFKTSDLQFGYAGYREIDVQGTVVSVPEPTSYALLLAGLGIMAFIARRRKQ